MVRGCVCGWVDVVDGDEGGWEVFCFDFFAWLVSSVCGMSGMGGC